MSGELIKKQADSVNKSKCPTRYLSPFFTHSRHHHFRPIEAGKNLVLTFKLLHAEFFMQSVSLLWSDDQSNGPSSADRCQLEWRNFRDAAQVRIFNYCEKVRRGIAGAGSVQDKKSKALAKIFGQATGMVADSAVTEIFNKKGAELSAPAPAPVPAPQSGAR